jgi:hypothetical protein
LLERMLVRAEICGHTADWRGDAFRAIAATAEPMPGVAAAALCGELGPVDGRSVFLASPVHCEAGMVSVRLPADGLIKLDPRDAEELAREFNRDFSDAAQRLIAAPSGRLFCVFAAATSAMTYDPAAVVGRDIWEFQPSGADAPRLRRLMSEIEMWLFEHAVNRERTAAGLAPLTGLWLWGGGAALSRLPGLGGWTAGNDPLFGAWPGRTEFPRRGGSGVVVLEAGPGTDAWRRAESEWLAPALEELRSGRIRRLELSAGEQRFIVNTGWSWRNWRRARPWWEWLQ